jgi:hypothetical protein
MHKMQELKAQAHKMQVSKDLTKVVDLTMMLPMLILRK